METFEKSIKSFLWSLIGNMTVSIGCLALKTRTKLKLRKVFKITLKIFLNFGELIRYGN